MLSWCKTNRILSFIDPLSASDQSLTAYSSNRVQASAAVGYRPRLLAQFERMLIFETESKLNREKNRKFVLCVSQLIVNQFCGDCLAMR